VLRITQQIAFLLTQPETQKASSKRGFLVGCI